MSQKLQNASLRVRQKVIKIKHWPTDTLSIDYHLNVKMVPENEDHDGSIQENCSRVEPHTTIVFIPGNPGCIGWYVPFLESIVKQLGVGYAVRGISYAGHGVGEDIVGPDDLHRTSQGDLLSHEKKRISWTIDGQVEHKLEWVDQWTKSVRPKSNLILIGHSIGCHILQRMCILRKDILSRTIHTIYLMPFIIFDPPLYSQKVFLNTGARTEILAKLILDTSTRIAKRIPQTFLDSLLEKLAGVHDKEGRILALNLITSPAMARNFLSLGMEELRDVPQIPDTSAIRLIGYQCPVSMLYCGTEEVPDQWAPSKHIRIFQEMQQNGKIPKTISFQLIELLLHDFVVHPEMLPPVIDYCLSCISISSIHKNEPVFLNSRL